MKTGIRGTVISLMAASAAFAGCSTLDVASPSLQSAYRPDNVYSFERRLPVEMRRVAVMPLTCDDQQTALVSGRDALGSVLIAELMKTRKFEVVTVRPDDLRRLTGKDRWSGEELLPAGMLDSLRENYGCDAVLFGRLTDFRAYAPLAVGWRLKLVDAHSGYTIWAGDELFDAGKPGVMAAVRHYREKQIKTGNAAEGDWAFLNSPRRFGQYAVAQMFDTLPAR